MSLINEKIIMWRYIRNDNSSFQLKYGYRINGIITYSDRPNRDVFSEYCWKTRHDERFNNKDTRHEKGHIQVTTITYTDNSKKRYIDFRSFVLRCKAFIARKRYINEVIPVIKDILTEILLADNVNDVLKFI